MSCFCCCVYLYFMYLATSIHSRGSFVFAWCPSTPVDTVALYDGRIGFYGSHETSVSCASPCKFLTALLCLWQRHISPLRASSDCRRMANNQQRQKHPARTPTAIRTEFSVLSRGDKNSNDKCTAAQSRQL